MASNHFLSTTFNMPPNVKRLILTTAVVSITITGTLYGAGLKTNEEIAQVRANPLDRRYPPTCSICEVIAKPAPTQTKKRQEESTFDEQYKALQGMRSNLVARKGILENQIQDLDARVLEKQQKGINKEDKEQPPGGR